MGGQMGGQMGTQSGIFKTLLGWIPTWVGFALIVLAGIVLIVWGAIAPSPGLIACGVAAIATAVIGYYSGVSSKPNINPMDKSFGGSVDAIDGWAWLIIFAIWVVAVIIAVIFH